MKQQIIIDVMQQMLPHLDNAQMQKLQKVLEYTLHGCEITVLEENDNDNSQLVESFISAKRIEGCSEKTLKYYRTTIETMLISVDKSIRYIQTEDLRSYLINYQKYSLESYAVNAFTRMLFESLDKRIMKLSPRVKKEYKKLYVAYKLDTNFVDIVFQKQRLRISINMKFSELNDPNGICKDISGLGRWGNGDVELFMEHQDELDQIMEIVKQSYDAQAEGGIDCGLAINIL